MNKTTTYLLVTTLLTVSNISCTSKIIEHQDITKRTNNSIVYLPSLNIFEEQEDDQLKYIVFNEDSLEIEEEGAEDIREIAVYNAHHSSEKITIVSTGEESTVQRVERIKQLISLFGVAEESISILDDPSQIFSDNVIMIKVHKTRIMTKDLALSQ